MQLTHSLTQERRKEGWRGLEEGNTSHMEIRFSFSCELQNKVLVYTITDVAMSHTLTVVLPVEYRRRYF